MSKYAFAAAAALSALIASSAAKAVDAANPQFTVSVNVLAGCTLTSGSGAGGAVTFEALGTGNKSSSRTKNLGVTCTEGTVANITLTSGNSSSGGFRMSSGGDTPAYIPYTVSYGNTQLVSGTAFQTAAGGTGNEDTITLNLATSVTKLPKPGAYSDLVTVTVEAYDGTS